MTNEKLTYLFREENGEVKNPFTHIEGVSFQENPLELFILLARYKFASRLLDKEMHVLDAGCGLGLGSVFLSHFSKHVDAIDFDRKMLERNKEQYSKINNISFNFMDLTQKHQGEKTYDAVISLDVIEHFPLDTIPHILENLATLTSPNGFAVIGTPNIASQPYASQRRKMSHLHEFEPEELKNSLRKYFSNVFLFSMTDENISLSFPNMAWYLMALCTK